MSIYILIILSGFIKRWYHFADPLQIIAVSILYLKYKCLSSCIFNYTVYVPCIHPMYSSNYIIHYQIIVLSQFFSPPRLYKSITKLFQQNKMRKLTYGQRDYFANCIWMIFSEKDQVINIDIFLK